MTGDSDPKWNEDASSAADAPIDGDIEDETKVILDDPNPPAKAEKDANAEKKPEKAEAAPSAVPGVARMKKSSTRAESGRSGIGGVLSGAVAVLWSGSKFLGRVTFDFVKLTLWRVPSHAYRCWRGIRSKKVRRGVALGVGLAIGVGIGLAYFWTSPAGDVSADSRQETCEFLARPAAKLYIDGRLASEEVPPIHRVRLAVGTHRVRFVSPENRSHEAKIEVVHGEPTQWFMNFVDNQMDERSLTPETESK